MDKPMTLLELHDAIAKSIADVVGHGMREKCSVHADAVLAVVFPKLAATAAKAWATVSDEKILDGCLIAMQTAQYQEAMRAWKDPTGFSAEMVLDEANNWTRRETGKEMLLNYAAMLAAPEYRS